ncbi:MAG: four helix bundle suffix domain-containing protein [Clostridium sp.]|nr:four helix bundle suffix domain-containing protein [Clostridium sp.]
MANIIQLGTQSFCDRFVDFRLDPGRRPYDQMTMAARGGVANIAEGCSRKSTSLEPQMRLLDVARASIDELQGDYFNFLLRNKIPAWPIGNPDREALWTMRMDKPEYSNSLLHDASIHILNQKSKFDRWIECDSVETRVNAMMILCLRVNKMLQRQLDSILDEFRNEGGFTENMTAERLEARRRQAAESGAPNCPKCGKPMIRRMRKKGEGQGTEFWGCGDYPRCDGTRR